MLSSRRIAQLGLFSASLILVGSVVVLVIGGSDMNPSAKPAGPSAVAGSSTADSIAADSNRAQPAGTLGTFQAQIPQPMVEKH